MGVWLPLALADIAELLCDLIRVHLVKPNEAKVPKRSELLYRWQLYFTASALEASEKEQEALALFNAVKNLQAKQEAK
jgi:hypothetical protein